MQIKDFVQGISFNYYYPMENKGKRYSMAKELNNIKWPINDVSFRKKIRIISDIPRNANMAYATGGIINKAVELMSSDQVFGCFGVGPCGFPWVISMLGNRDKICIGIDNIKQKKLRPYYHIYAKENHKYHHCARTKSWKTYACLFYLYLVGIYKKAGVVFINIKKDIYYILIELHEMIADKGIIIINNTNNLKNVYGDVLEFLGEYKEFHEIYHQETAYEKHITFRNGLCIIQKGK